MRLTHLVIAGLAPFALALGACPRDDAQINVPPPATVVITPAAAPAPPDKKDGVRIHAGSNGGSVNVENGDGKIGVRFGKDGQVDLEVDKDKK